MIEWYQVISYSFTKVIRILSIILLMSVLFYILNCQYDMEKEIVKLKTEQMKLMECDYESLNNTYSANTRLYHNLYNHLETLYAYSA